MQQKGEDSPALEKKRWYDPIALSKKVEEAVVLRRNNSVLRRYYRFRRDRWYGGIATGDVVGCNLRCGFCWAYRFAWTTSRGAFLPPEKVVEKLVSIAKRFKLKQVRLSGGEPTIAFSHLLKVVEGVVEEGLHFVLETNGILLGVWKNYAKRLAGFHGAGIEVRVSLKGTSPEEFYILTGADPKAWNFQLKALENLVVYGLEPGEEVYPAIMLSFSSDKDVKRIKRMLSAIEPRLASAIDPEYIILYRHVEKLLEARRLKPRVAYRPGEVPPELI